MKRNKKYNPKQIIKQKVQASCFVFTHGNMKKVTIQGKCLNIVASARRSVNVKANEFVRVFGLDIAKMAINECPPEYDLDTVELKRLVESHELVESWGGLDDANFALQLVRYPERLKQAIADVESCQ